MRSPRPHGPSSWSDLLGACTLRFSDISCVSRDAVENPGAGCLPRSRRGGFNPGKLKVSSFVSVFVPAGQKILHHRSDVLETVVLINPSDEAVSTEVGIQLASRAGPHTGQGPAQWRDWAGGRRGAWDRKVLGPGCWV